MSEYPEINPESELVKEAEKFAKDLAKEVGDKLVKLRAGIKPSEWKLRTNFKTEADDMADKLIRERIEAKFPDHRIMSEELSAKETSSEYVWVVDPLDGTIPYTNKSSEHYGVAISLCKGTEPVLGVFYAPTLGEGSQPQLFSASQGEGAFCNGKKIYCSAIDNLNKAFMAMDFGKLERSKIQTLNEKLLADDGVGYLTVYAGCASSMAQVADGRLHGYFCLKNEPWDMAAAAVICKEAGCIVTNINGEGWKLGDESIVALPPGLQKQFFEKIAL